MQAAAEMDGKTPSPETLQLVYEYIIANILPRMIEGEKAKGNL